jgi:hypothetical protein
MNLSRFLRIYEEVEIPMKITITRKGFPLKPRQDQALKQFILDMAILGKAGTYDVEDLSVEEFAKKCANGYA